MNIQILTNNPENYSEYSEKGITVSFFNDFQSMDGFDLNVIDLASETFWNENVNRKFPFWQSTFCKRMRVGIQTSQKTNILLVLPQSFNVTVGKEKQSLLDHYTDVWDTASILLGWADTSSIRYRNSDFEYTVAEKTKTTIGNKCYNACVSLAFEPYNKSDISEKTVTSKINEKIITSLDIFQSYDHFIIFIEQFENDKKEPVPEWFKEIKRFDDNECQNMIEETEKNIAELNDKIWLSWKSCGFEICEEFV